MSTGERRYHLLAYDIREPRRLVRVHRYMRRTAVPLQYSVFLGWWNQRDVAAVLAGVSDIIDTAVDDVRCYPLPGRCEPITLGASLLPEGVDLLDGAANADAPGALLRLATGATGESSARTARCV